MAIAGGQPDGREVRLNLYNYVMTSARVLGKNLGIVFESIRNSVGKGHCPTSVKKGIEGEAHI